MIRSVSLGNFKCFPKVDFSFGKLNVLAGPNGTGKSTVMQALLALYQSARSGQLAKGLVQLNGPLIELGTGQDVRYRESDEDGFRIAVGFDDATLTFFAAVPTDEFNQDLKVTTSPPNASVEILAREIHYLSADRLGPQKSYPIPSGVPLQNPIGRRGEFAPYVYDLRRRDRIENALLGLENQEKKLFTDVENQFEIWMQRLFPGFDAQTTRLNSLDAVLLGLTQQSQVGERKYQRPGNVGFGVSIVLPIVLAGLLGRPGTTLFVENPEAHLHPSGQSLLGEFLVRVAAHGPQVFVETHSDHVINGIRLALKNALVSREALRFFAFSKGAEYGSHAVTEVKLDDAGEFLVRPDSFFDQADKDLRLIYGIE